MSFSNSVKTELCQLPIDQRKDALSELAAFVRYNASIHISGQTVSIAFLTEHNASARRIYQLIKYVYASTVPIATRSSEQRKRRSFQILLKDPDIVRHLLNASGFLTSGILPDDIGMDKRYLNTVAQLRAFLRGAYLASGSISNPEKMYHLEIVTASEASCDLLMEIMSSFNLRPKRTKRKDYQMVYLKDSDMISDFLNVVGAHQHLFQLEDVRVKKDLRNRVTRAMNCDHANMDKTINAAMKQTQAILYISEKIGLDALPDSLRKIAEIRLENREASMQEIGDLMDPPLGKSGVNHRFRKIMERYDTLRKDRKDIDGLKA